MPGFSFLFSVMSISLFQKKLQFQFFDYPIQGDLPILDDPSQFVDIFQRSLLYNGVRDEIDFYRQDLQQLP